MRPFVIQHSIKYESIEMRSTMIRRDVPTPVCFDYEYHYSSTCFHCVLITSRLLLLYICVCVCVYITQFQLHYSTYYCTGSNIYINIYTQYLYTVIQILIKMISSNSNAWYVNV